MMFYNKNISFEKTSESFKLREVRKSNLKLKSLIFSFFLLFSANIFAQKKTQPENKESTKQDYAKAEADFRVKKSKAENKSVASYNLGNTIYKQGSYEESKYSYLEVIEKSENKAEKHMAYHNLGNALMQEKNYQAAVDAYKNALRNNPYDEQTRYNFALAKEMLEKNPPPPDQNQDDQNQDNQDQNEENQNKENQKGGDNQEENQDNQDQNQDQGENQDQQEQKGDGNQDQKPEGNQSGIPKQRMQNLLDAVENQEKGIQQRIQKRKELQERKGQPRQVEKNW